MAPVQRDVCPVCGGDVAVMSGLEGTNFYVPANTAEETQSSIDLETLTRFVREITRKIGIVPPESVGRVLDRWPEDG